MNDTIAESLVFYVLGSHARCIADASTGEVLYIEENDCASNDCEYATIARFDVAEWRASYPEVELAGMSVDILDVGYTLKDRTYETPQLDWRAEFRNCAEAI